jgi:phosphohistidine swiveling domain-containing protein
MSRSFLDFNNTQNDFALFGGGKAKNLAVLTNAGIPVPEWFCISSSVLDDYLDSHQLRQQLVPQEDLESFAIRVEKTFLAHPLSPLFERELEVKLMDLGWLDVPLAVRSSGLDEDSKDHSFAGLFSSFLFQKGIASVSESIRRSWASAYSARALSYRAQRAILSKQPKMGVVIQRMVNAEVAGVLFTRNPLKPLDRDHLIIESVWGLGEGLVSGELDADHFVVNRNSGSIVESRLAEKTHAMRRASEGGISKEPVPPNLVKSTSLNANQVLELKNASMVLETLAGGSPQDIEWTIENGRISFVQMRPVTSLPPESFYHPQVNGHEATLWDNSNIIESYSGVTSPFTFSYASHAYHQVYRQFAQMMNVPEKVILDQEFRLRNMLGLVRGRIYYNLINWYRLLMMMPGSAGNPAFMETMMGVKKSLSSEHQKVFDFMKTPPRYGVGFQLNLIAISLWRFWRSDSIIREFKEHFTSLYQEGRKQNFRSWSLQRQIEYFLYLQKEILPRWRAPIVNDFLCMVFFGLLKKLTEKWVQSGDEGASLQNDLLCGQGDLESTEPTKMLMRIAKSIDQGDGNFRNWFTTQTTEEVWKGLGSGKNPEVYQQFKTFLDLYGFRCVNELKFEERDLHDDPGFVVGNVASYVRMKTYSIEKMEERENQIRNQAESIVKLKIKGFKRFIYFWILKHARKAVRNREDLRFDRTKSYGLVRHLMRAVGGNFVQLSLIDDEFDVFYLTLEEIISFVEGRLPTHSLRDLVNIRKPIYEEYRKTPSPPDRFVTYGAAGVSMAFLSVLDAGDLLKDLKPKSDDPNLLFGTPCCPGIVEGVVRVAHELKDTENLQGEILVTSRTDPGWVPLYPSCSGLLIERGSLLSHSAVVARELGLPTIVGISGGLMTRLRSGQKVRIDAGKGEIRIL